MLYWRIKKICVVVSVIIYPSHIYSQANNSDVVIHLLDKKPSIKTKYVPFSKIVVLDNRAGRPNYIYTFEEGKSPIVHLAFDLSPAEAMQKYLELVIEPLQKSSHSIVINLQEFHIPNNGTYKSGTGLKKRYYNTRNYLRFFAQIFIKSDKNGYNKIATLRLFKVMHPDNAVSVNEFKDMFNDILYYVSAIVEDRDGKTGIRIKRKPYWKNAENFELSNDSSEYSMDDLNMSAQKRWSYSPILHIGNLPDGTFASFEDFKAGKLCRDSINLVLDTTDSLFVMKKAINNPKSDSDNPPWAVSVSGNLYFRLWNMSFIKLNKTSSSFSFQLPGLLPDMYTILSLKENYRRHATRSAATGNIFGDLSAIVVLGAIDEIRKSSTTKEINKRSNDHNFRDCLIDMDCGDIIYEPGEY